MNERRRIVSGRRGGPLSRGLTAAALLRWALFAFLMWVGPVVAADAPRIAVAVAEDLEAAEMVPQPAGAALLVYGPDGEKLLETKEAVRFAPSMLGISADGEGFWKDSLVVRPKGGAAALGDLLLDGEILILKISDRLTVVNRLDLEDYLVGILAAEASAAWPEEALKAQAVVARTYALKRIAARRKAPFDIRGTVAHQVFRGSLKDDPASAPLVEAVRATRGEALYYDGELIEAVYHSCCGGSTESSKNLWGRDLPYLRGVPCEFCVAAPHYFWKALLGVDDFLSAVSLLGVKGSVLKNLVPDERDDRDRVSEVAVETDRGVFKVRGPDLRGALGPETLKSTRFKARLKGDEVWFVGSGFGHGVGMCQWGARGQAVKGRSYEEILPYYYPGVSLEAAY